MEGKVAVKDLLQVEDKPRHTLDNIIDAPQKNEKPSRKHIISFHDLLYIPTSMYYVFEELYNLCCQLGSTLLSLNLSNSEHPHKIKEQPSTLMGLLRIKLDEVKKENRNLRAMLNQITQHYAVLKNRLLLTMQQQQQSSLPRNYHGLQEKYWIMHYHLNGESMDKRQLRVTLDLGLTTVATWELCPVRKKVERCAKDETAVTTSYEGNHNHAIPPPPDPWPPQRQQH